jgi:hypothetical protein
VGLYEIGSAFGAFGSAVTGIVPGAQALVAIGAIATQLDAEPDHAQVLNPLPRDPYARGGPLWGIAVHPDDRERYLAGWGWAASRIDSSIRPAGSLPSVDSSGSGTLRTSDGSTVLSARDLAGAEWIARGQEHRGMVGWHNALDGRSGPGNGVLVRSGYFGGNPRTGWRRLHGWNSVGPTGAAAAPVIVRVDAVRATIARWSAQLAAAPDEPTFDDLDRRNANERLYAEWSDQVALTGSAGYLTETREEWIAARPDRVEAHRAARDRRPELYEREARDWHEWRSAIAYERARQDALDAALAVAEANLRAVERDVQAGSLPAEALLSAALHRDLIAQGGTPETSSTAENLAPVEVELGERAGSNPSSALTLALAAAAFLIA